MATQFEVELRRVPGKRLGLGIATTQSNKTTIMTIATDSVASGGTQIQIGDVITHINGKPIMSAEHARSMIAMYSHDLLLRLKIQKSPSPGVPLMSMAPSPSVVLSYTSGAPNMQSISPSEAVLQKNRALQTSLAQNRMQYMQPAPLYQPPSINQQLIQQNQYYPQFQYRPPQPPQIQQQQNWNPYAPIAVSQYQPVQQYHYQQPIETFPSQYNPPTQVPMANIPPQPESVQVPSFPFVSPTMSPAISPKSSTTNLLAKSILSKTGGEKSVKHVSHVFVPEIIEISFDEDLDPNKPRRKVPRRA